MYQVLQAVEGVKPRIEENVTGGCKIEGKRSARGKGGAPVIRCPGMVPGESNIRGGGNTFDDRM